MPKTTVASITKGTKVSYAGFGPGKVLSVKGRAPNKVALLYVPHQDLRIELPLAHAVDSGRLRPLVGERKAKMMLKISDTGAEKLNESWSMRRDQVADRVRGNDPNQWTKLVTDYLGFVAGGGQLSVSDHDLLDQALSLIAAESAFVLGRDYDEVHTELRARWRDAAREARPAPTT